MTHIRETLVTRRYRMLAAGALTVLFGASVACSSTPQAREAKYLRRGEAYMAKKDYARAFLEFRNASRVMPQDGEPYYQVGLTYMAMGNVANGAEAFRKATELNPKDQRAQLRLGELMAGSGSKDVVKLATDRLEEVLSASPNNSDASDALALAEWKLGKTDEAFSRLEDTLRKFPSRLQTSVELARLKLGQKDLAGAEQVLKQALARDPRSVLAELALGQLYMVTKQPAKAEVELRKAIQLDPKNGTALMGLAAIQTAGKRMAEAEQTYLRIAALPSAEFKPMHALFLFNQGKRDAALAEFEKLAKEYPNDRAAQSRLFAAYVAMGKSQAAQNLAAAALKKNPKDTDALFDRAGLSLRSGNIVEAEKDLRAVLRFKPDFAEGHAAMAAVDRAKGLTLDERHELNESLRINPALLQPRLALARNYIAAKEAKSALDVLNAAPANQKGVLAFVVERNWALLGVGDTKEMRSALDQNLRTGRSPELVVQDGVLRLRLADYSGAIADAEEAIKNNDLRGARLLAGAYLAQKQPRKAEDRLQELAALHPKSAPLANVLGQLYLEDGNRAAARKAFEAALAANPRFLDADLSLAGIDTQEKHLDAAHRRLLGLVAANPKNITVLLMLGGVAADMGDQEEALQRYRAAIAIDGSNVFALTGLAYTLASSQPDEALKYAQQAAQLAPDSAMVEDTLGWIYYRKTVYGIALNYLKTAAEKEPTPRRQFHLAMCYLREGQRDMGEQTLQLALRQDPSLPVTEKGW